MYTRQSSSSWNPRSSSKFHFLPILQIQMAYGMPLPPVPFSYFYPSKLPNNSAASLDPSKFMQANNFISPINFSKRTLDLVDGHKSNNHHHQNQHSHHHHHEKISSPASMDRMSHKDESKDCEVLSSAEDSENLEID